MTNANKGYIGWSMSVRAMDAYEAGEMPKSKWTKRAMLDEIARYMEDNWLTLGANADAYVAKLTKDELFSRFFRCSSWHHTSKCFNATDFYSLDEDAVEEYVEHPTSRAYIIVYILGKSKVTCKTTFKTRALAEKYLQRRGFSRLSNMLGMFKKDSFRADIDYETVEI